MNLNKLPLYSLPKIYGWHILSKNDFKDTGKIFKHLGANWWDLLYTNELPLHLNQVTLKTKNAHAIIFINLAKYSVKMANNDTGDVYHVMPAKRSIVNNTHNREVTFSSDTDNNYIHVTKIGSVWLVMLNVQEVQSGNSLIRHTPIFNDFLLMCGIPDEDQYMMTAGLEFLNSIEIDGWDYHGTYNTVKNQFAYDLIDHWQTTNPRRKNHIDNTIPHTIQWIWLRRDIKTQKFGELKPVFYKFMDTWIKRNPDFEFNIWTDNPNFKVPKKYQGIITIRGPDEISQLINELPAGKIRKGIKYLYNNHPNVGARSDTIRQCILYLRGGIYSDINDGVCLVPMDDLCNSFDFLIGMEPVLYVNNAIIASAPGHIIPQHMITHLAHSAEDFVDEWTNHFADQDQDAKDDYIVNTTGPIAMTYVIADILNRYIDELQYSLILPSSWVYPNYWMRDEPSSWLKPVSITAHFDRRDYLK